MCLKMYFIYDDSEPRLLKIALIWHQKINELYHVGQGLTSEIFLWLLNFFVKETLWRKLEIVS